ncbi:hypothetical protein DL98DRAFT_39515 [Cadophora sp. DSE1049]|nr:hypothetical protein DL98DRAFT_39515 [Cadophora sp. DSE1049]
MSTTCIHKREPSRHLIQFALLLCHSKSQRPSGGCEHGQMERIACGFRSRAACRRISFLLHIRKPPAHKYKKRQSVTASSLTASVSSLRNASCPTCCSIRPLHFRIFPILATASLGLWRED